MGPVNDVSLTISFRYDEEIYHMIFLLTMKTMLHLLAFIILGYLLCRFHLIGEKMQKFISDLVATVLIAVLVFNAIYFHFSAEKINETLIFVALYLGGAAIMLLLSFLFAKKQGLPGGQSGSLLAGCFLINVGYIGLPVIQDLPIGKNAVLYAGASIILVNLLLGFLAEPFIRHFAGVRRRERRSLWKALLSPSLIGFLCGMTVYFLKMPLPGFLREGLELTGACIAPLAMVVIGCKLFSCEWKEIFGDKKLYLICLTRMLIFPVAVFLPACLICRDATMLTSFAILISCPPLLILPIFADRYSGDGQWCTRFVFLSTLMSMFTIPLVLLIIGFII